MNNKPDAIIMSDLHMQLTNPRCRIDSYFLALARKITFITKLQEQYQCPIFDAGDLFTRSKVTPELEAWAIKNLPEQIFTVPGNHDLKYHSLDYFHKTSLNVLYVANKVKVIFEPILHENYRLIGFPWESDLRCKIDHNPKKKNVALVHTMIYHKNPVYTKDGVVGTNAIALMKKLKDFDLIVTGHNHVPFVVKRNDQLLVNPGSIMRRTADQIDHKPRVYLWYADSNEVKPVFLPIEKDVISCRHIEKQHAFDARMEELMESLEMNIEIDLKFERNMENFLVQNKISDSVQEWVYKSMETNRGSMV